MRELLFEADCIAHGGKRHLVKLRNLLRWAFDFNRLKQSLCRDAALHDDGVTKLSAGIEHNGLARHSERKPAGHDLSVELEIEKAGKHDTVKRALSSL